MQWLEMINLLRSLRELLASVAPTRIRDLIELLQKVIVVLNKVADFLDQFHQPFAAATEGVELTAEEQENRALVKAELDGLYQDLTSVLTNYMKNSIN